MGLLSTIGAASGRAFGFTRSAIAAATDAFFNRVTLLLPGNGTNGAQNNTFLDSSSNNFTITRNGNTTQGTFSPFSQTGWSNFFDGATGTRFTLSSSSDFAFGTGAYTMEASVFITARGANDSVVFDCGSLANSAGLTVTTTGQIALGRYGVGNVFTSNAGDVPLNQWVHIAIVRTSTSTNDTRMYANGTLVATGTDNNNWSVTTTPGIGGINVSGFSLSGYISNLRIIKGSAVTPPTGGVTSPLTAVTNTALLTCQSNRFIDTNTQVAAKTLTVNGTISVQAFSPFAPTAAYSAATVGGSGYFDGSGDYLTFSSNAALGFGTGDYTVEAWVYFTAISGAALQIIFRSGAGGDNFYFHVDSDQISVGTGSTFISNQATTFNTNTWYHVAACRSGGTLRLFRDGVQVGSSVTDSTNWVSTGTAGVGSNETGIQTFFGYISNCRVIKGTALYTTTFTPPTAPSTAVSGTSLLLNFTNAGITDATAKNDLETVGNAQISTTQSKFGGSSMYFDGTGDYLKALLTPNLQFGTGDFTFECWVYANSLAASKAGEQTLITAGANGFLISIWNQNVHLAQDFVADLTDWASTGVTNTTWFHLAITRSGTSMRCFVNGTQAGSTYTNSTNYTGTSFVYLGANGSGGTAFNGYIDDMRITKGYARYTANFTAPTAAFPLQ